MAYLTRRNGNYILRDKSVGLWRKLGPISFTKAREVLQRYETDSTYLKLDLPIAPSKITFPELVAEYCKDIQNVKAPSTVKMETAHLAWYSRKWSSMRIHEITTALVEGSFAEKKYTPHTIHYRAKILRNLFKYALKKKYLPKNPAEEVRLPRLEELPPRYSDPKIIEKLFLHMNGRILAFFKILYYTGMRPGEALRLKQEDIDIGNGRLFITKTKTGKFRVIPIHKKLVPYLKEVGTGLCLSPRQINHGLKQAIKKAGVKENITPYVFRHTFATQILSKTANLRAVQMLLGHARSTMTERYAHVLNQQLKDAVGTL